MKKTILRCLVFCVVMALTCQWTMAATNVTFAGTYQDPDTSGITQYYQKPPGNALSKTEGEALAGGIFAYTGSTFILDTAESTDKMLLYRNVNGKTGICYIELTTGKVLFNKGMENYLIPGETVNLPDDTIAPQLAHNHLTALNLLPSTGLVLDHVGKLGMAIHEETGTNYEYKKLVMVYENRDLDGLRVLGSSRLVTGLGANGELVSLGKCWVNASPVPVLPTDILKGIAIRDRITARLMEAYPYADYIEVQDQLLMYYDDGQGIIEPALWLSGIVLPQGETQYQDVDWVVSIMVTPHATYPYDFSTVPIPADRPPDPSGIPLGEQE